MRKKKFFWAAILGSLLAISTSLVQAQTFHPLHDFIGGTDGAFPEGGLVRDAA